MAFVRAVIYGLIAANLSFMDDDLLIESSFIRYLCKEPIRVMIAKVALFENR